MGTRHAICALALLGLAGATQAAPAPRGDTFLLNPDLAPSAYSSGPWVMRAPGGGFAATWTESNSTEVEGSRQLARVYSAAGVALAPAVPVNQRYDRSGSGYAAGDRAGNFVVVWSYETGAPPAETSGGVYGRRFDASGAPLGDEFEIAPPPVSLSGVLDVSMAPDGRFVVAWYGAPGTDGSYGLDARLFDTAGTPLTPVRRLVSVTGTLGHPQVLLRDDGSFVAAYACNGECGGRGEFFTGFLQVFDADGDPAGGRSELGVETHIDSLDPLPGGGFQLLWTQPGADFSEQHIYLRRYRDDTTPDAPGIRVDAGAHRQTIATGVDPRGAGLVTWRSPADDLVARDLGVEGAPAGPPYAIAPARLSYPGAAVSFDSAGELLLAWVCEQDGRSTLCARRYGEAVEPPPAPDVTAPLGNNEVAGAPGVGVLGLLGIAALRRRRR